MSDEEFLNLDNAPEYYNEVTWRMVGIDETLVINPQFMSIIDPENTRYKANITEMLIQELCSDTFNFYMDIPIEISDEHLYANEFSVYLLSKEYSFEPTDENIMLMAKITYCLNQVMDFFYLGTNLLDIPSDNETIITGDVNLDRAVDLYDAIWIASDLADIFDFTEGQQAIGDVNEDGECNLYDAVEIAKTLM